MLMRLHDKITPARRQTGAILLIAMIVLVAMTLSALSLIKSVNTTNLIAGNLGFRESAALSSERSTEVAARWLMDQARIGNETGGVRPLNQDHTGNCYKASREDPDSSASPPKTWDDLIVNSANCTLPADAAGNTVYYVIHRLCENTGPRDTAKCSLSPRLSSGDSQKSDGGNVGVVQIYYRITTRVNGPRNTKVYTQTILAM